MAASAEAKAAKPTEAGAAANATSQPATAKSADAELRAALGSFASRKSVPTHLNVSYLDAPGSGALLTASVQVSTLGLSYGADNKQPAAVDLAGVVLNDQGKSVNGFKTRLNVNPLPAGVAQTDEASVIYNYKAPLPPGLYQVRAAARDEKSGLVGSSQQWIEIPDLTNRKLTLSSLLVGGKVFDKGAKAAGGAAGDAAAATGSAPQVQFSVDKRFARASRLSFWIFIYNASRAGAAPPDVTAQVHVFRGAEAVVTTQPRKLTTEGMSDLARIPYGGEFALSSLAPGRYTLQVTITDRVANTSVAQRSFFEVE